MDANPPFRCRRRGAPIRPRGRRSVDAGRTPECIRGRPPLWRGPPADCDRVLASLRGHRCARLAFPDRALPTLAPAGAPADQVGRRGRCCRDRHLARFPALGWLAMGRDARAAGDAGRRRVRARRARSTHQPRDRYAPPPPLRHRPPHQPHARVRRDDRGTWRPLRPGDPRAADGAPSAHPGERAGRRALDARRGSALQPGAYPHPTRRRSALLPLALRRDAHARLARAAPARRSGPRRPPRRAPHRRPRHHAAGAREPLAAGASEVMTVAARPRILLQGGADIASALSALGDVTTDPAPVADLVVFDATADRSFAELQRIVAHDDGAWRPVLVIAADDDLRVAALDAGADAVVGPRVESAELVARARALLRIKVRHDAVERQAAQFTDWTPSLVSRPAEQG